MANVKVRLKDASNNVLHPETDWSVVLNKPSIKLKYNDGSHNTGAESVVDTVAKIVGPGEAWDTYSNGDKSIVIGNSDNALGFCGTNSKRLFTMFQSQHNINVASNGSINMSATGNINIKSRETNNQSVSLADYPIKWSAISGMPDYITADVRDITFGHYSTIEANPDGTGYEGMIYPAIRTINYTSNPGGDHYWYTCFYFNGTSWAKFSDSSKFSPGF